MGPERSLHAQQPGNGEPPDVSVEQAHHEAPPGEGHGQVDRDRGLPYTAFSRGHGQHARGWRYVCGQGAVLLRLASRPLHQGAALLWFHLAHDDLHVLDPGETGHASLDIGSQLGAERTARHGEGHLDDHGPVGADGDASGHAQVDDVVAEFGVDDA
jgi:hypothetical protein